MKADSVPLVTVRGVSKKFSTQLRRSLWYGLLDIAAELWPGARRPKTRLRTSEFWGVQGVDFELYQGEALAIIGANGAGKSTLLKLLNGLIKPDAGYIRMLGRVGALIELGVGLDPALTGRENIYLRAALMGVTRAQVQPMLPAIIDFTGLGAAIETPVQFYSSGMVSRLAYAVAAHLHPDVLLVDEVLAVGDFDFQRKCLNHMLGYLARGGSLILVSHQAHHVQAVCQRGIVLEKGCIAFAGTATEALDYYFNQHLTLTHPAAMQLGGEPTPSQERPVVIQQLAITGNSAKIRPNDEVLISLTYHALVCLEEVSWSFRFYTHDGNVCITGARQTHAVTLQPGVHTLRCRVPRLPLMAGQYQVRAVIFEQERLHPLAVWGWENLPTSLRVEVESGVGANIDKILQQLVTIEVEWMS